MPNSSRKIVSLAGKAQEATRLLRADHKLVNELFEKFESTRSAEKKQALALEICQELTIHAQIEEEIFYPAVEKVLKDKSLVPEAKVEHETLKYLIAQIQGEEPGSEMYDAKVKVLAEYVKHHVKEEQNEIFPKVKESKLDLIELGAQLATRKEELKSAAI
ncbi:MAG: hemerythrin [Cellvibrio sp. 79]|nr:MAG: hemerythrin [Cellvibrio sp. 79]